MGIFLKAIGRVILVSLILFAIWYFLPDDVKKIGYEYDFTFPTAVGIYLVMETVILGFNITRYTKWRRNGRKCVDMYGRSKKGSCIHCKHHDHCDLYEDRGA